MSCPEDGGFSRIAAEQAMVAKDPQVTGLADNGLLQPGGVDLIGRVGGVLLEIGLDLIDLDRVEAGDTKIKPFLNEEIRELGELQCQSFPIPAGLLRELVVGQREGSLSCLRQAMHLDHRDLDDAKQLCRREPAVTGQDRPVLVRDDWRRKPEGLDAGGNLSDLLFGVSARIARIGSELVARDHAIDAMHEHLRRA